jgi:threonine dehydratase
MAGCELHFKAEHLHALGAFKFRGACNAVVVARGRQSPGAGVVTHRPATTAPRSRSPRGRGASLPRGRAGQRGGCQGRRDPGLRRDAALLRPDHRRARSGLRVVQADTGAELVHPYPTRA